MYKILRLTDFSKASEAGISWAADFSDLHENIEIELLHCIGYPKNTGILQGLRNQLDKSLSPK